MAEQLVLVGLDRKSAPPPRPAPHAWRLDRRTVAVGRRGLEQARQALHRAPQTAA